MGEKEPFDDISETHGKCTECLKQPEPKYYDSGFFISAWIDLLGQSYALEKGRPPKSNESQEEYAKVFVAAFGPVIKFRKQIRQVSAALDKLPEPPTEIVLDPHKLELYKKYTQQNIQLSFIADSAVLRIPLVESYLNPPLMSVLSLLYRLSINMLTLLAMEMPIRGGVAVGFCTKIDNDDVYGQSDSRAHWAESKRAKYPRIIIHNSLLQFLNAWEQAGDNEEEKRLNVQLVALIKSFFEMDNYLGEKDIILSYLSASFKGEDEETSSFHQSAQRASQFISKEILRFRSANNSELLPRYEALNAYFERHGYKSNGISEGSKNG